MDDGKGYIAHDTADRSCQHLNCFQHKCYLHAKVPRVKQANGKIKTQTVPWARKGNAFTMLLIENETPVNKVPKIIQSYPNRLWTIFKHWISVARKRDIIEDLGKIGFDETSVRKGYKYITITRCAN